jgi:NCAIR mutase (PurE)-related protein
MLLELLAAIQEGRVTPQQGVERLARLPYEELDFAKIDHHRPLRTGLPEAIYAAGKTDVQVTEIFARMAAGGGNVLATRVGPGAAAMVRARVPAAEYHELARMLVLQQQDPKPLPGPLAVLCAEEAAVTAALMGHTVVRVADVGVAGLHRLLAHLETLAAARVIIVCAGMEGALPTAVAGLVRAPVIAVPTSVGYGASFGGVAALLGMLNSCAPNVAVMNIDNGFGAACFATSILGAIEPPAA